MTSVDEEISRLEQALRRAGPHAVAEELEALGLARVRPRELFQVFREALDKGDIPLALAAQTALRKHPQGLKVVRRRGIPLLPLDKLPPIESAFRKFLFVSGVPRSGTTALGLFFGGHRDVAMYIELYEAEFGYLPEMFVPENVRRLGELRLLTWGAGHEKVLAKSARAETSGDKRPGFLRTAELTLANFAAHKIRIVHIVRSVYDVAASYQHRFEAGIWKFDFRTAVHNANDSNRLALSLLKSRHRDKIIVVDYDRFWKLEANLYGLLGVAGLDPAGLQPERVRKLIDIARAKSESRDCRLSDSQRAWIAENHDAAKEEELKSRSPYLICQSK